MSILGIQVLSQRQEEREEAAAGRALLAATEPAAADFAEPQAAVLTSRDRPVANLLPLQFFPVFWHLTEQASRACGAIRGVN